MKIPIIPIWYIGGDLPTLQVGPGDSAVPGLVMRLHRRHGWNHSGISFELWRRDNVVAERKIGGGRTEEYERYCGMGRAKTASELGWEQLEAERDAIQEKWNAIHRERREKRDARISRSRREKRRLAEIERLRSADRDGLAA